MPSENQDAKPFANSSRHSRRRLGILQVGTAGLCFGFLGVFGRLAYRSGISLGELLTFRFMLATLVLVVGLAILSPRRLKISLSQALGCAGLGVLGYAIFSTLYFQAIEGASVALASLLLYTYPVWVAVGARLAFKEKLTRAQMIALPVAGLGLILLIAGGASLATATTKGPTTFALVSGLGSAVAYAIYILVSSRIQKALDPITSGVFVMGFAAIGLSLIHQPDFSRLLVFNFEQLAILFGIAIICTVAPLVLFLSGLQKLGNTEASLMSTVEPLTAAVAGSLLLGEVLSTRELIGGLMVIAALTLTSFLDQKPNPKHDPKHEQAPVI